MEWRKQLDVLMANVMALGARRLIALAVAAVSVLLVVAAIAMYTSRPETEPLYTGLSQADVGRIGSSLNEAGIAFDVGADGTKVFVRRAQAPRARMILAERGLPAGSTSGYELFDKLGPLGLTSFMQDVTRVRALEGELARTIQTIKGISTARVHIVMPSSGSFQRNRQPASASVVIRSEIAARNQQTAGIIKHLVAAAVPGLAADTVSVMSTDGTMLATAGDAAANGSTKMIELEQSVSRQVQENVRRTLAPYLGIENFEVSASARINLDKRQINEQAYDPESKSERSARVVKETGSAQNASPKQAVTVEQNVPTEQGAGGAADLQSRKNNERREEVTNYELTSKSSTTVSEGHRLESLQVSLVVNRKRIQNAGDAAAFDRQIKEIEAIAAAAAGLDTKRGDRISVAAVDFIDTTAEAGSKPSALERLSMHLDTIIISLTAIAALLILLWLGLLPAVRAIIAQKAAAIEGGQLLTPGAALTGPEGTQPVVPETLANALPSPRANPVQRKLADLIEQDEKQVAEILKQWLVRS
jgi:flagellar M-ring protein FliF